MPRTDRHCVRVVALAALAVCALGMRSAAGQAPERGAFVLVIGAADTFAVENFTREADVLTGELTGRAIGRMAYSADVGVDGAVQRMTLRYWGPGALDAGEPVQAATLSVEGDTVVVAITTPTDIEPQRFASEPGTFLYLNPSFLLIEQVLLHGRTTGDEPVELPVFMAQGEATIRARITNAESTTPRLAIGADIDLTVGEDGRLESAEITRQGLRVTRVDGTHLPSVAVAGSGASVESGEPVADR